MDHLPVPSDPVLRPPRIRYQCLKEYDRGDFITYPERQGWTKEELLTGSTWIEIDTPRARGLRAATAFLQQWLFFGLLHAVFGNVANFQDYIDVDETGTKYVHTRNLFAHANKWARKLPSRNWDSRRGINTRHMSRCLEAASGTLDTARCQSETPLNRFFLLSLSSLGEFIAHVLEDLSSRHLEMTHITWGPPFMESRIAASYPEHAIIGDKLDILSYAMAKKGWCPRAVAILQNPDVDIQNRYFASLLRNIQGGRGTHKGCSQTRCIASQVEKSTYRTVHDSAGCNCHFHGFDSAEVGRIVQDGCLPLMVWDRTKKVLNLIPGGFDLVYVAISHVWSDGLGNPDGNAMPQCQLEALDELVQRLYPSETAQIPFWIDTLCCPVSDMEARKTAIRKMRDTYTYADTVLVLDKSLRSTNMAGRSIHELGLYIASSGWCSRLWTLQEGALPDTLLFQFSDGTMDARKLNKQIKSTALEFDSCWGVGDDVLSSLYCSFRGILRYYEPSDKSSLTESTANRGPIFALEECAEGMSNRATSVGEDEAVCLASLMALDLETILNADRQDRMKQFWLQFTDVSEDWIYYPLARLDSPGFRWAPRTLLGVRESFPPSSYNRAIVTEHGLLVDAFSLSLQSLRLPLSHPVSDLLWIRRTGGKWAFVASKDDPSSTGFSSVFNIPDIPFTRIVLLMTNRAFALTGSTRFVMAFVTKECGGVTYAHRGDCGHIWMPDHREREWRAGREHDMVRKKELQRGRWRQWRRGLCVDSGDRNVSKEGKNYLLDNEYAAVYGDFSDGSSRWCID